MIGKLKEWYNEKKKNLGKLAKKAGLAATIAGVIMAYSGNANATPVETQIRTSNNPLIVRIVDFDKKNGKFVYDRKESKVKRYSNEEKLLKNLNKKNNKYVVTFVDENNDKKPDKIFFKGEKNSYIVNKEGELIPLSKLDINDLQAWNEIKKNGIIKQYFDQSKQRSIKNEVTIESNQIIKTIDSIGKSTKKQYLLKSPIILDYNKKQNNKKAFTQNSYIGKSAEGIFTLYKGPNRKIVTLTPVNWKDMFEFIERKIPYGKPQVISIDEKGNMVTETAYKYFRNGNEIVAFEDKNYNNRLDENEKYQIFNFIPSKKKEEKINIMGSFIKVIKNTPSYLIDKKGNKIKVIEEPSVFALDTAKEVYDKKGNIKRVEFNALISKLVSEKKKKEFSLSIDDNEDDLNYIEKPLEVAKLHYDINNKNLSLSLSNEESLKAWKKYKKNSLKELADDYMLGPNHTIKVLPLSNDNSTILPINYKALSEVLRDLKGNVPVFFNKLVVPTKSAYEELSKSREFYNNILKRVEEGDINVSNIDVNNVKVKVPKTIKEMIINNIINNNVKENYAKHSFREMVSFGIGAGVGINLATAKSVNEFFSLYNSRWILEKAGMTSLPIIGYEIVKSLEQTNDQSYFSFKDQINSLSHKNWEYFKWFIFGLAVGTNYGNNIGTNSHSTYTTPFTNPTVPPANPPQTPAPGY